MTLALLRGDDFWYQLVYLLHILTIIAGFGPTFVYPIFSNSAKKRPGAEGAAINETTLKIAERFEWFIYLVPVFGIILVLLSEDVYEFSQAWISIAFVLYFVALGISLGLHLPNLRKMNELQRQLVSGDAAAGGSAGGPPPQVAELEARGKRAGMYGGILHLLLLLLLIDMVWKPGF